MKTKLFKSLTILALFLISNTLLHAQLENTNWYFGIQSALNFNDGTLPPTLVTNSLMSTEWSAASVSDNSGNLLFYTNGKSVWDASHQIMANGNNLLGNTDISQDVVIVPFPGSPSKYYVFHNAGNEMGFTGVSYSVVDMTLNEGLGDVDINEKNVSIQGNSCIRMAASLNPSDDSYWLIIFGTDDNPLENNTFFIYKVDSSGVTLTNTANFTFPYTQSNNAFVYGQMKLSPDYQSLALIYNRTEDDGKNLTNAQSIFTFDFDVNLGTVSTLNSSINLSDNLYSYGIEFSPDSNLLYVSGTHKFTDQSQVGRIYQVDYKGMNNTTLLVDDLNPIYGLQIGIDQKIYAANSTGNLHRIDSPNVLGSGAGFNSNAINISGNGGREFPQQVPFVTSPTKSLLSTYNTSFANDTITRLVASDNGLVAFGQVGSDNSDNLPGEPLNFVAEYDNNGTVLNSGSFQIPYDFEVPIDESTYTWSSLPDGTSLSGNVTKNYKLGKYNSQNELMFEVTTTNINENLIEDATSNQTYLVFPTTSFEDFSITGSTGRTWAKSATQNFSNDGTLFTKTLNLARFDLDGVLIGVVELINYKWHRTATEGTVDVTYPRKITGDNNTLFFTVASRDEDTFTEVAKIFLTNGESHKKGEWLIGYDVRNNTFNKAKLVGQAGSVTPNELIYNQSTLYRKRKNKLYKLDQNLVDIDSLVTTKLQVLDTNKDEGTFIILGENTRTLKKIDSNFEEIWSQTLGKKFTITAASQADNGDVYFGASYNEEAKLFSSDGDIIIEHNSGDDIFIGKFLPPTESMMSMKLSTLENNSFERRPENESEYRGEYEIYPNPFDNSITMRSRINKYSIEVYDLSGKLVLKKSVNLTNKNNSKLNTTSLKKGIYNMKIIDDRSKIYYKKIVKN